MNNNLKGAVSIKTSIIILTYNNLKYTKLCIKSIRKYTAKDSYEIIVVDNNSTDETVDWLKQQNDIKTIFNKENLGFPKGCNKGISIAEGEDILLLNNDVVVTPNWLENLKKSLYSSKDIGAVGSVTNKCSNFQAIPTAYKDLNYMLKFALKFNVSDYRKWEQRLKLVGFCMLIKREVIDKVGLLDERFSPGNYEDDDYCLRIRKAGYKLMLCKDTFIHHFGSISFKQKYDKSNELLNINKKKFKDKWDVDSSYFSNIRKDAVPMIKKYKNISLNILHIGCEGGGTLLDIKNRIPNARLFGIDNSDKSIIEKIGFADITLGNLKKIQSYEKRFFNYIINSIYCDDIDRIIEDLLILKEYINDSGRIISVLPDNFEENLELFDLKIKESFNDFTYELYMKSNGLLLYLYRKKESKISSLLINKNEIKNLPLVSILIPTYNRPHYFEITLNSVLNQTYKNIEIIIGDDSTNNETELIIEKYLEQYENIRYFRNGENIGQFNNDIKLFDLAEGEYVNYLMDDDVFAPDKIEKMMRYFLRDEKGEIKLVTSHRQKINENGIRLPNTGVTHRLFDKDTVLEGIYLGNFILVNNYNCIGEPTTPLFRKKDLIEPFGVFNNREYGCNYDTASWLNLLSQGKCVYIAETLSYFRVHDNQQLNSNKMKLSGALDYAHEILTSSQKGFFKNKAEYLKAVSNCLRYISTVIDSFNNEDVNQIRFEQLKNYYNQLRKRKIELNNRKTFTEKKEFPLVSILIPAYNRPYYLEIALKSALNQTYKNIEIIICDDSTNQQVEKMLVPYLKRYRNIRYFKNEEKLGTTTGLENAQKCYELAKGEYVNFLLDDDVFHENKIQEMMNYFLQYKDISLVTSYRQVIDGRGNNLRPLKATKRLFQNDTIVNGKKLAKYVLKNSINAIGELTTVLFRKEDLQGKLGMYMDTQYKPLSDVAAWLVLLSKGKAAYISDTLSYFRTHEGQNANEFSNIISACIEWFYLIKSSYKTNFIDDIDEYNMMLNNWFFKNIYIVRNVYISISDRESYEINKDSIEEIYKCFRECIKALFGKDIYADEVSIKGLLSIIEEYETR